MQKEKEQIYELVDYFSTDNFTVFAVKKPTENIENNDIGLCERILERGLKS